MEFSFVTLSGKTGVFSNLELSSTPIFYSCGCLCHQHQSKNFLVGRWDISCGGCADATTLLFLIQLSLLPYYPNFVENYDRIKGR
jgi:hypothetical protein